MRVSGSEGRPTVISDTCIIGSATDRITCWASRDDPELLVARSDTHPRPTRQYHMDRWRTLSVDDIAGRIHSPP